MKKVIYMKVSGEYVREEITDNQIRMLEDRVIMGKMFIKIGKENYNLMHIMKWKIVEEDDAK